MNKDFLYEKARKYLEYDMIMQHTDLPAFPVSRTRLLHVFLNKGAHTSRFSELFPLIASLVQMGLDTHDLVGNDTVPDQRQNRSRQLKVLAGDYFSSRFYQLLAQAGQIDVVRFLSQAICEVNRLKMNFYTRFSQWKMSAEEYVQHKVEIKMELFLPFTDMMEGMYRKYWPDVLKGFTRCEVLAEELGRAGSPDHFRGSWAFWHMLEHETEEEKRRLVESEWDSGKILPLLAKHRIAAKLYQMLDAELGKVIGKFGCFGSDRMDELHQIGEAYRQTLKAANVLEKHEVT